MYVNQTCSFATGKPLIMRHYNDYKSADYKSKDWPNIIQIDKSF